MSYSVDGGATWIVLDTTSQSFKGFGYYMNYDSYGGMDKLAAVPGYTQEMFAYSERAFYLVNEEYESRDADR